MRPPETIAKLETFKNRGAGTDSERRAANWLATEIGTGTREAHIEPFWCRPNWALAHAWHAALGVAGSLVAESEPRVGGALIIVALLSLIADEAIGLSLGRRLTPEHASQNVVSERSPESDAVHLVVTANYDAGRGGLMYRGRVRQALAQARGAVGGWTPGWLGWLAIALLWLIAMAILRLEGHRDTVVGIAQLIPTVGLVLALALLLEQASAHFGSAANDNASGVAAALALVRALDAAAPRHLQVDLVLQGAGDGGGLGLRQYLRKRRAALTAPRAVVLGVAPCAGGSPQWFESDGPLVPLIYFRELRRLCESVAGQDPGLEARPHKGRGHTPALPARHRRLPAIALGSSQASGEVDPNAVDRTVEFGLLLVDAIDAYIGRRAQSAPAASPTPA